MTLAQAPLKCSLGGNRAAGSRQARHWSRSSSHTRSDLRSSNRAARPTRAAGRRADRGQSRTAAWVHGGEPGTPSWPLRAEPRGTVPKQPSLIHPCAARGTQWLQCRRPSRDGAKAMPRCGSTCAACRKRQTSPFRPPKGRGPRTPVSFSPAKRRVLGTARGDHHRAVGPQATASG
jgi:hypothetical protein